MLKGTGKEQEESLEQIDVSWMCALCQKLCLGILEKVLTKVWLKKLATMERKNKVCFNVN